jgi:hypothetical protein
VAAPIFSGDGSTTAAVDFSAGAMTRRTAARVRATAAVPQVGMDGDGAAVARRCGGGLLLHGRMGATVTARHVCDDGGRRRRRDDDGAGAGDGAGDGAGGVTLLPPELD